MKKIAIPITLMFAFMLLLPSVQGYAFPGHDNKLAELKNHLNNPNKIQEAPIIEPPEPPQSPPNNENNNGGGGGGSSCDSQCRYYRNLPKMYNQCFSELATEVRPMIKEDMKLMDIFQPLSNPNYWLCSGDMWRVFRPFF